ncbi:MAG: flagellar basal body P-ring protein FlgI, partial [Planctomycetes bacterium]|nr:flagellar basal body P-ring protein FlgI [Planctomycetota bacterium]
MLSSQLLRRSFLVGGIVPTLAVIGASGCSSAFFRGQSPDVEELVEDIENPRFVGDVTGTWGINFAKVEAVALVTQLNGTGSDPRPSGRREKLIGDMLANKVRTPKTVLESPDTSLVLVRAFLPPGIQKGDRFDVEVRIPSRSQTASLLGGYLMGTRLQPMEVLGPSIKTGHVMALAKGPVLVDSVFEGDDDQVLHTRGKVLGGGVATVSRKMGLVVRDSAKSIQTTMRIARAVNKRFHTTHRGRKTGVASPKNNEYVELLLPAQYKHNIARYIRVVRNIAYYESSQERYARLNLLRKQLHEPTRAAIAALRLEGLGDEAVETLKEGMQSQNSEIRFYAAEALAYMDVDEAIEPLAETARTLIAFRYHALTALAAMDAVESDTALRDLLHVASAETRYGAFRAMQAKSSADPLVRGKIMGDGFYYHLIPSTGAPMVHFSRSRRPEIVLFGADQPLRPGFVFVQAGWTVRSAGEGRMKVSHFQLDDENDKHETCSNNLDSVIRTVAKLGGGYAQIDVRIGRAEPARVVQAAGQRKVDHAVATAQADPAVAGAVAAGPGEEIEIQTGLTATGEDLDHAA